MQRKTTGLLEPEMREDHYRILTGGGESGQTSARHAPLLISPDSCHDLDLKIPTLLAVLLALASSALAADCPKDQPKTDTALIALEQNWASALTHTDAHTARCMG